MLVNILAFFVVIYFTYQQFLEVAPNANSVLDILVGVGPWFVGYVLIWYVLKRIKDFII